MYTASIRRINTHTLYMCDWLGNRISVYCCIHRSDTIWLSLHTHITIWLSLHTHIAVLLLLHTRMTSYTDLILYNSYTDLILYDYCVIHVFCISIALYTNYFTPRSDTIWFIQRSSTYKDLLHTKILYWYYTIHTQIWYYMIIASYTYFV